MKSNQQLTPGQRRRVVEARVETQRILDAERAYMPKHQDAEYLARYEAHAARLDNMLAEG